jgi:hypothetical protein
MSWNASLLGAKMVRSGVVLTASVRLVALTAPRKALRPASWATVLTFGGIVRRPSMMWMTPPSNAMSWQLLAYIKYELVGTTYSFGDGHVVLETSNDRDLVVDHTALDDLASSDVSIGSVVEKGGREGRRFGDV